jgi:glucose-6-phosphate isomerase
MKLRYGRLFQDRLDGEHGLRRERLSELSRRFPEIRAEVKQRKSAGEYGFYGLADQGATVRNIRQFADGVGQAYDHVLVLGIGGSALGVKTLLNALREPGWNELSDEGREFFPRLTVLDKRRRRASADRSAARAGERDQQVRRHRGDHGPVPRGARLART